MSDPARPLPLSVRLPGTLRRLREARQWSVAELSRVSGYSVRAIEQLEAGRCSPRLETAEDLAGAFGLTIEALFAEARR